MVPEAPNKPMAALRHSELYLPLMVAVKARMVQVTVEKAETEAPEAAAVSATMVMVDIEVAPEEMVLSVVAEAPEAVVVMALMNTLTPLVDLVGFTEVPEATALQADIVSPSVLMDLL